MISSWHQNYFFMYFYQYSSSNLLKRFDTRNSFEISDRSVHSQSYHWLCLHFVLQSDSNIFSDGLDSRFLLSWCFFLVHWYPLRIQLQRWVSSRSSGCQDDWIWYLKERVSSMMEQRSLSFSWCSGWSNHMQLEESQWSIQISTSIQLGCLRILSVIHGFRS